MRVSRWQEGQVSIGTQPEPGEATSGHDTPGREVTSKWRNWEDDPALFFPSEDLDALPTVSIEPDFTAAGHKAVIVDAGCHGTFPGARSTGELSNNPALGLTTHRITRRRPARWRSPSMYRKAIAESMNVVRTQVSTIGIPLFGK
jgi:hypothetical protein